MKKTKIGVIIVALVMIVAGLGLLIGGVMAAGGIDAARNSLEEQGVFIDKDNQIDIGDFGDTAEKRFGFGGKSETYKIKEVDSLELEIGAAKMEILTGNSAETISVNSNGSYDIFLKNGVLHLETKMDLEDREIVIEIPENTRFKNVDISGTACEVQIQYLDAKEMDVEVDAGLVFIERMDAVKAEFDIGAGEIFVDDASVGECSVQVGMGNFEFQGDILKHGDVECGMGNAKLYLEGNEEDYNYEVECAAGNVEIGTQSIGGVSAEQMINNDADVTIEVECGMGNVTIDF